jgi:catalase-peroxidase
LAKEIADLKILLETVGGADGVHGVGIGRPFRSSDKRGGQRRAHPARTAEGLGVNQPAQLAKVLKALEGISRLQREPRAARGVARRLIVLPAARASSGHKKGRRHRGVPFKPGRMDASGSRRTESFAVSAARRRLPQLPGGKFVVSAGLLLDKAQLLTLTAPDDGARRRHACWGPTPAARAGLHLEAETLLTTSSSTCSTCVRVEAGWRRVRRRDRKTGKVKWTGTRVDVVFGSNSQLRALARMRRGREESS